MYVRVSFAPVEFLVRVCETLIVRTTTETEGVLPVVIEPAASSQTNTLPETNQLLPTISDIVAEAPPLSRRPAALILNVCWFPSHRSGSHGVMSISYSFKSKASIPKIGLHRPGTTPPVKMTGNGH